MMILNGGKNYKALLLLILLIAETSHALTPGSNLLKIGHNKRTRELIIELPKDYKKGKKYPVVFGFHGAGGPVEAYNRRLAPFVNKHKLISISILGTKQGPKEPTAWNFKDNFRNDADDVGFVKELIKSLNADNMIDMRRIYATGSSSGGLFCYRLAKETGLFAAMAPTKCGMAVNAHEPNVKTRPVSIMQVIGNKDKSFNGGRGQGPVEMYSAEERIKIWVKHNQCNLKPVIDTKKKEMTITRYTNDNGIEVVFCMLHNQGHHIRKDLAEKTDTMIIEFFLRHAKQE